MILAVCQRATNLALEERNIAVNRREFLLTVAGAAAGWVLLPQDFREVGNLPAGKLPEIRLITLPTKSPTADGRFMLVWVESTPDGTRTMMWNPETPEELADATAFYDAARRHEGVPGLEQPPRTLAGKAAQWLRGLFEPDPARRAELNRNYWRRL